MAMIRKKHLLLLLALLLILSLPAGLFAVTRCGRQQEDDQNPDESSHNPSGTTIDYSLYDLAEEPQAEIITGDQFTPQEYADDWRFVPDCSLDATLLMADGPGEPDTESAQTSFPGENKALLLTGGSYRDQVLAPAIAPSSQPILIPWPIATPTLGIINPFATPTPSAAVTVENPAAGSVLTAGNKFTLEWSVSINRTFTIDILLSTDDGKSYREIVRKTENTGSYTLTIPDSLSESCHFRVNVWSNDELFGYNYSPDFKIAPAPTPTVKPSPTPTTSPPPAPTPTVKPSPTPTTSPPPAPTPTSVPEPSPSPAPTPEAADDRLEPQFSPQDGQFISSSGDPVRWFKLEHELANVDHIVWQISRVEFPCTETGAAQDAPGLLVQGQLSAAADKFKLDFAAITNRLEHRQDDPVLDQLPDNQGEPFEVLSEVVLTTQAQRSLFVRVILFDEKDQVIGVTKSDFAVNYGLAYVDVLPLASDPSFDQLGKPVISAKTEPGFSSGEFEEIPDKGFAIYTGNDTDWSFMLSEIPKETISFSLQIASVPFVMENQSDWESPDGLVFQAPHIFIQVKHFFHVSFSDFAELPLYRADGTTVYYMRAVCYLPGNAAGTTVPIVSETYKIIYTGDFLIYMASQFDPSDMEPEELVVEANVPYTDFQRFIPARLPLKKYEEYFEVTRPIEAEEICFYIKNSKTGDFLYPYNVHMYLFPNTTREQYQAVVDRMLPPGAWFHLTITQSGWDAFWSEFTSLLQQIYSSIQNAYSDLKTTVANTVADQFSFLGPDIQSYIRTAVTALIDYGLASVGLPPTLPNFEQLAEQGLDYCVQVALYETAKTAGVSVDELPDSIRQEISSEMKKELSRLAGMRDVNPFNVDYLKPAEEAAYRPAYVDVKVFNDKSQTSPPGTLAISYYPVGKSHFSLFKYASVPVPPLKPGQSTSIRVHLKLDHTDLPIFYDYYWGDIGECQFRLTVTYDAPAVEEAAAEQNITGSIPGRPVVYQYDRDPVYEIVRISPPSESFYD